MQQPGPCFIDATRHVLRHVLFMNAKGHVLSMQLAGSGASCFILWMLEYVLIHHEFQEQLSVQLVYNKSHHAKASKRGAAGSPTRECFPVVCFG